MIEQAVHAIEKTAAIIVGLKLSDVCFAFENGIALGIPIGKLVQVQTTCLFELLKMLSIEWRQAENVFLPVMTNNFPR